MYQQQLQGEGDMDEGEEMEDSPESREMVADEGDLDDENDIEG